MIDELWLVWQESSSRLFYHVGTLTYDGEIYRFRYTYKESEKDGFHIKAAQKKGYLLHPMFSSLKKTYESTDLFEAFQRRLPSVNRVNFISILEDLNLSNEFSKMGLLERTRGKLGSDQYSFEKPLIIHNNKMTTSFYINGMRYQNIPDDLNSYVTEGQQLDLEFEIDNPIDSEAIAIYSQNGIQLGYVPRFYAIKINQYVEEHSDFEPNLIAKVRDIIYSINLGWLIYVDFTCEDVAIKKTLQDYNNFTLFNRTVKKRKNVRLRCNREVTPKS